MEFINYVTIFTLSIAVLYVVFYSLGKLYISLGLITKREIENELVWNVLAVTTALLLTLLTIALPFIVLAVLVNFVRQFG